MEYICWSKSILLGDKNTLMKIEEKFASIPNNHLTYETYPLLFDTDVSDIEEEDWGGKEFIYKTYWEGNNLVIEGESEYYPVDGLFEFLSQEWIVDCDMLFKEKHLDLTTRLTWKKGEPDEEEEWTYYEYLFMMDEEKFYEESSNDSIAMGDRARFLARIAPYRWRTKPNVDLERIK